MVAQYPLTGPSAIVEPSRTFATGIATTLVANGLSASASTTPTDTVLADHQGALVASEARFARCS